VSAETAAARTDTPVLPRWVLVLSAAVALTTVTPHAYQALTVPPDDVFTGCVESVDDQNAYLTRVEQVRRGRLFVQDLATAEETPRRLANPPWLIIGLIARAIPLPTVVTYQVVRVTWAFGYLLLVWLLARGFFRRSEPRLFAFVIAALGSGLGWIADAVNALAGRTVIFSADVMPELWGYHSLQIPHFILSEALIVLLVLTLLRGWRRPGALVGPAAFAIAVLLAYIHPFDVAVLVPLLVGHSVFCRITRCQGGRHTGVNLWAAAGMIPPVAFYWWELHNSPIVAAWAEQNLLRSPPPLSYLLGLGIVLPLAIIGRGMLRARGRNGPEVWLMIFWVLVTGVAVYSYPVLTFERRCVEGLHLPLTLLAGIGVSDWLVPALQRRLKGWGERRVLVLALALVLAGILPTNLKLLADGATDPEPRIPADWLRSFAWVDANTPPDARIFTHHVVGGFLARYALRHVHLGHWQLTIDVDRKREMSQRFFAPETPDTERLAILRASGCGWVAAPPRPAARLSGVEGLSVVFDAGGLLILRLDNPPPPPRLEPR